MTMSDSPEKPESGIRFGRRRRNRGRPAPEGIFVETVTHTLSLQISKYSDLHFVSEFFGSKTAGGIIFFVDKYHVCASTGKKCHRPNDGGSTDQTDRHNAVTNQFVMSSLPFWRGPICDWWLYHTWCQMKSYLEKKWWTYSNFSETVSSGLTMYRRREADMMAPLLTWKKIAK